MQKLRFLHFLCLQFCAAVDLAREIQAQKNRPTPSFKERGPVRFSDSSEHQNSGVYFTENITLRGSPKLLLPLSWLYADVMYCLSNRLLALTASPISGVS